MANIYKEREGWHTTTGGRRLFVIRTLLASSEGAATQAEFDAFKDTMPEGASIRYGKGRQALKIVDAEGGYAHYEFTSYEFEKE